MIFNTVALEKPINNHKLIRETRAISKHKVDSVTFLRIG